MSKMKGPLSTPFTHAPQNDVGATHTGIFNHHPTPSVSKPRDLGPGDTSVKFFEDVPHKKAALDTPFGTAIEGLGRKK